MGVTIHFEGRLRSLQDLEEVIEKGRVFATRAGVEVFKIDSDHKHLSRVKDEKDWDYEGPVKGIHFVPDRNADPLNLEFDRDLYIQEYCKTQFAGTEFHAEVSAFLHEIEQHFVQLEVYDDAEFYETGDMLMLEEKFQDFWVAFENAKQEDPKLNGPFRIPSGRIVDLMKDPE